MIPNHSIPAATVIPVLVYPDVRAAVAWLSEAFGFQERVRIGEAHRSQLRIGADGALIVADVVGPLCETGDYLALGRELTAPKPGDLLAIMTAGAYGAVQGSTYNTRPLVPEILVRGADAALVRRRQTYDELIGLDRVPEWLA